MAIIVGDVTDLQHSPQPITFTSSCREYESISNVDKIVPKYCNISKILGRGTIDTPLSPLFGGMNVRVLLRLNGLRKTFGIKIMIVYPRFASRMVYKSLLYIFKVAMRAKTQRFQITRDISKFYLHHARQINSNRSLVFSILLRIVQSEISYIICTALSILFWISSRSPFAGSEAIY